MTPFDALLVWLLVSAAVMRVVVRLVNAPLPDPGERS